METPRTPEKEIISVQYYNVIFYMIFRRGIDTLKQSALSGWIKSGSNIRMKDIYGWCTAQNIPVVMKFKYRKDFPIKANLWNFISYCRFRRDMKRMPKQKIPGLAIALSYCISSKEH